MKCFYFLIARICFFLTFIILFRFPHNCHTSRCQSRRRYYNVTYRYLGTNHMSCDVSGPWNSYCSPCRCMRRRRTCLSPDTRNTRCARFPCNGGMCPPAGNPGALRRKLLPVVLHLPVAAQHPYRQPGTRVQ